MSEKVATPPEEKKEDQPAKKPVEMSPEELEEQKNAFMQRLYPGYEFKETEKAEPGNPTGVKEPDAQPDKKQPPKEEPPPEDEAAKKKSEEEQARKKAEEEASNKKDLPPPISEFKLPKDEPDDRPSPATKLNRRDQRNVEILRKLEEMEPKYRGKADEYVAYLSAAESYIGKWQKENPGKKFNAKDEEHQEFMTANYPEVDEDDLEEARFEYMKDQVIQDSQSKTKKEIEELRKEQESGKREPEIAKIAERSVLNYLQEADEGLAKHLKKDDNGMVYVDKETMDAMEKEDPLAANIVTETAEPLRIMVTELEKASANPGKFEFNPGKAVRLKESGVNFYPHAELINFMNEFESSMLRIPAEKTTFNGRRLVSTDDFSEMEQKILKAKTSNKEKEKALRDLDSKYYYVTADIMRAGLVSKYAKIAKSQIERLRKLSGKNGTVDPGKAAEDNGAKAETTPTKSKENKSPSLASNSDTVDTSKKSENAGELTTDKAVRRMFGG